MEKAIADIIMVSMGVNISKLNIKIQADQRGVIEYKTSLA